MKALFIKFLTIEIEVKIQIFLSLETLVFHLYSLEKRKVGFQQPNMIVQSYNANIGNISRLDSFRSILLRVICINY